MNHVLVKIEQIRKENKMPTKEFAERIGITKQIYSNWIHERSTSWKLKLPQIAEALNVTVEYLTTGKESAAERFYRAYMNASTRDRKIIDLILDITE